MSRISFARLFSVLALTFGASDLSASTITYAVGTCRPSLPSYSTISAALAAVPPANVIEVCPGTYNEQVQITQPVTLEGVTSGSASSGLLAQAIIAPPAGGLIANATDALGNSVAAQLWVDNVAAGPVHIKKLTVDGTGNGVSGNTFVVGVFYRNSSGTVNHVVTRNQSGSGGGIGIWAEGGSSNPLVTIENNSVHDYDFIGIETETGFASSPDLTAAINDNEIAGGQYGIQAGSNVTVTNNLVEGNFTGILFFGGGAASISGNTVVGSSGAIGIDIQADASVTSNKIMTSNQGILLEFGVAVAAVQGNSITNSLVGIEFTCIPDPNVHSNIISDTEIGLHEFPDFLAIPSNKYFNVGSIVTFSGSGC